MKFRKMHGLGNDFIVMDLLGGGDAEKLKSRARELCDRHFGIGADGQVMILPSETCDAQMRIINSDGTEPEMCGNAIRCVARYLRETGAAGESMSIETLGGVKNITIYENMRASVDMGAPEITGAWVTVVDGARAKFTCVSTGNPHVVTFDALPDGEVLLREGLRISTHPFFPKGVNVEFCQIENPSEITMRVYERGAGATLACGTGATASFFAAHAQGLVENHASVHLTGGTLDFDMLENGHVIMTGPSETSFIGEI